METTNPTPRLGPFPGGKAFAFTILDDTDVATRENVEPIYRALAERGMRTTKTVWPFDWTGPHSAFRQSETLANSQYRQFAQRLAEQGFEIASHGATMESSPRADTIDAFSAHQEIFGQTPRVHANHSWNRDNLYWGVERFDALPLRWLTGFRSKSRGYFQGEDTLSPYFWGDLCHEHIDYVRNLTFRALNVMRINPSMPYLDPRRPWVRAWFSTADANDVEDFVQLLSTESLDQLEHEGGVCILSTHFGKGYAPGGKLDNRVRRILDQLAARNGWYVPVSELLDWMAKKHQGIRALPSAEWRRMQWHWAAQSLRRAA